MYCIFSFNPWNTYILPLQMEHWNQRDDLSDYSPDPRYKSTWMLSLYLFYKISTTKSRCFWRPAGDDNRIIYFPANNPLQVKEDVSWRSLGHLDSPSLNTAISAVGNSHPMWATLLLTFSQQISKSLILHRWEEVHLPPPPPIEPFISKICATDSVSMKLS